MRKVVGKSGTIKIYDLVKPDLEKHRIKCGRDKLHKILKENNLNIKPRKKYMTTTNSRHRFRKHPNLIKELDICRPEQVWVSDITYIKCNNKHLYLALITDVYSKKIMGYNLADNLRAENALEALKMAISKREYPNKKLIHHSDRGFQYCCDDYTNHLTDNHIKISMTQQYDPYENAVAERVNGILKQEFDIDLGFVNQKQAQREIKKAINVYNNIRPHLSCHMKTPVNAHKNGDYTLKRWSKMKTQNQLMIM